MKNHLLLLSITAGCIAAGSALAETPTVVNETFVRTFLPGVDNAVGRRIRPESSRNPQPWITIVGVVEDVKHYGLERPMRPGLYLE